MPIFKSIEQNEATGKVKDIYDEIKKVRQISEIPNFWKSLANNPETLERVKKYEQRLENANQELENKVNTLVVEKIELDKTISDRIDIMQIIDKYKFTSDIPHHHVPHDHDGDGYPDH